MKRIFNYILILVMLAGVFTVTKKVDAQTPPPTPLPACTYISTIYVNDPTNKPCVGSAFWDTGVTYEADDTSPSSWLGCLTMGSFTSCLLDGFTSLIVNLLYTLLTIVSALLWIAGTLLDFVIRYTVVDMKLHLSGGIAADGTVYSGLTGINIAWKVIKDLMNIAFIFILVFEGIKLILGLGSREHIKKFIVGLILASLLINFSLFFTKILIDASNIITLGIYDSIIINSSATVGGTGGPPCVPSPTTTCPTRSISGLSVPFMNALGLSNFWSGVSFDALKNNAGGDTNLMIIPIMGIILFVIVSFVFFAVALIFTVRYMTLVILLMLSPVAYMGMALPFMQGYAKQWWDSLNGQLLFGPIYMIMTWVALTLMSSTGFITGGNWGEVVQGITKVGLNYDQQPISLVFNFIIIIGLIIATLTIAKSTASQGSKFIGSATGTLTAFAGGAILGGAGRIGRRTVGRWGNDALNNEDLKDRAVNGGIVSRNLAKMSLAAANKANTSSFDVRANEQFGSLAKAGGLNFGKVDKKANYKDELKARTDEFETKAKMYKPNAEVEAEAKAKDKELKKEIDNANNRLKSEEFNRDAENKRREEFEKTDAWKNSPEAKAEAEAKIALENYKNAALESEKSEQRIIQMQKDADSTIIPERKAQIEAEIKNLKQQSETKKSDIIALKNLADSKKSAIDAADKARKSWESDEKKSLSAIAKTDEKKYQNEVKDTYQRRVDAYANRVENSVMSRFGNVARKVTGGTIGAVAGGTVAAITGSPVAIKMGVFGGAMTGANMGNNQNKVRKEERNAFGRKIRGVTGEKSRAERIAELAIEDQAEKDKAKNTESGATEPKVEEPKAEEPKPETPKAA